MESNKDPCSQKERKRHLKPVTQLSTLEINQTQSHQEEMIKIEVEESEIKK